MGNMAAFFATKKAKELAAIAQHPLPPVEDVMSPTVAAAMASIEATDSALTGAPCPNCGRPLSKQGRHLHIRRCIVP